MYTPANPIPDGAIYWLARGLGFDDEASRVAIAVAWTEAGRTGDRGDGGRSCGPYQFYEGGQLANFAREYGLSLADACSYVEQHQEEAIGWALTHYLGAAIARGQALGYHGAELATYVQDTGQVSDHPERTGANYGLIANVDYPPPPGVPDVPPDEPPIEPVPLPVMSPTIALLLGLLLTGGGAALWLQGRS